MAAPSRQGRLRPFIVFALLFAVYQTSEYLQTQIASPGILGPVLMIAVVLIAWPLGRWMGWHGYDAYGLDHSRASIAWLAGGMVLAFLAKLAALSFGLGLGAYSTASAPVPLPVVAILNAVAIAAITTFIPSIAEDILTRGIAFRASRIAWHPAIFIVTTAIIYTLNHVWRFDWGPSEQFRLFCLGLAYGAAAWRARSLWGAVALHWGWNFANATSDLILPVTAANDVAGRYMTAGAHLAMLLVVLALPAVRQRSGNAYP